MKIIKGSSHPKAEEKTFYELSNLINDFGIGFFDKKPEEKLIWTLYKSVDKKWKKIEGNIKEGPKVPYTFGEKVVGIPYKIVVHSVGKHSVTQKIETTQVAYLVITPRTAKEPAIGRVILLNRDNSNVNKAKFNESLSAEARTSNMFNKEITFYLWEEATPEKDRYKKPKTARVDKNGIAKVKFNLSEYATPETWTSFFSGDKNTTKKFFVTAEYLNKEVTNKGAVVVSDGTSQPAPNTKKQGDGPAYTVIRKMTEIVAEGLGKLFESSEEKATANIGTKKIDKNKSDEKCPRCENDITLEQIKAICVSKKNDRGVEMCLISDDKFIKSALPFLNKYKNKADITTCITKAHFLSQISQETKFYDLQERFKYSDPERMRKLFYSYFKQFGELKKQQVEAKRLSDLSFDSKNWKTVANAIYGKTHPNGKNNNDDDDGWRYSGKGFKQITWRDNYIKIEKIAKSVFGKEVVWLHNDNPYKLAKSPEDAILSGLAFWKLNNVSSVAIEISDDAVTNVTKLINPYLAGLDERKRYFKKAVEILEVEKCKPKGKISDSDEDGTVVVVSGTEHKKEKDPAQNIYWLMYKTSVYKNMSLKTYYELEKNNKLPDADYITYLSRDTHQVESKKLGTLKHSDKRFGQYNEIPPGEYFLVPCVSGQSYKVYVIDSESKSADSGNGIEGPDGDRGGVALHHYCPRFSVGCFTFNSGKNEQPVSDFISQIPDLKINDKKPVRFIVRPRKVVESNWNNANYGTKKWTGI